MENINQQLYKIPRVFVQGDRDPEGEARNAATILGQLLYSKGWGVTAGAYGGFVEVLEKSGVSCVCHETRIKDHGDIKMKNSSSIKCQEIGEAVTAMLGGGIFKKATDEISWTIRLGIWMGTSKAYCFFAGREGTLAHLIPVLTYNIKGWIKKGSPRKVCLIGWEIADLLAIMKLFNIQENNWFRIYHLDQIKEAVEFLTT